MSLISPKLTEFVLLLVAVAAVVVSGPLGEDLLTSVMLELVRALLLLIQSVVMLAVVVVSVVVEEESAAAVPSLSVAKQPEELVVSGTQALKSVALVVLLVVAVSAVVVVPNSALKLPEEQVAFSTKGAYVDKLVSNVEAASVEFAPLVHVQSALDKALLAAAQLVAKLATSALAVKEEALAVKEKGSVLSTAKDTATVSLKADIDTTRDGE